MSGPATLHLTVGLPGAGKTTLARHVAAETGALRLTPDEWMIPLFGESDAGGRRDVLEGRLIWVAHQVVAAGGSVILDFGCWSPQERYAIRAVAAAAGARFELHHLEVDETERRRRTDRRFREHPDTEFEMDDTEHARVLAHYQAPTVEELTPAAMPPAPVPAEGWLAWASSRWPSLPRLDRPER